MNRTLSLVVLFLGGLVILSLSNGPLCARAGTVDSAVIPDGTYTVKVERVVDPRHVDVLMDNGSEATLASGRDSVNFSKVRPNDQLKLSVIKGTVMVYADLTTH